MKKIKLHWQILIALVLAVLFGYFIPQGVKYVAWMGEIFLTSLKMVIIPLILSSIISGVTSMGSGNNLGRMGAKTMLYYLSTSTLAIVTGLIMVNLIKPGVGVEMGFTESVAGIAENTGSVNDILMRIVPPNIFDAMVKGEILPVIFFAIIFGVFITKVKGKYKETLTTFFEAVFEVMMKMTMFIIKFTPVGVFGLVAKTVAEQADNILNLVQVLGLYSLTVLIALAVHAFIVLPFFLKFIAKVKPFAYFEEYLKGRPDWCNDAMLDNALRKTYPERFL